MVKLIFQYESYKDYLKHNLHSKDSKRGIQSALARHLNCQAAYLYQVLKGKGHLTEDQAFKVTTFFKLNSSEQNYFLLSVRAAKSNSQELKSYLKQKMENIRSQELELKNKADSIVATSDDELWNYYFSDALPSAIHLLVSSEQFQTAEHIAQKLNISTKEVQGHLQKLLRFGFVTSKGNRWSYSSPSIHFPKDSHHNTIMQAIRRSQVMSSLFLKSQDSIHFASSFTLDLKSVETLRFMISEFIEKSQKTIHAGGTDDLYVMCLDFFKPFPSKNN